MIVKSHASLSTSDFTGSQPLIPKGWMCVCVGQGRELGKAGVDRNVLTAVRKDGAFCQVPSSYLSPLPFLFSVLQPGRCLGQPRLQPNLILSIREVMNYKSVDSITIRGEFCVGWSLLLARE